MKKHVGLRRGIAKRKRRIKDLIHLAKKRFGNVAKKEAAFSKLLAEEPRKAVKKIIESGDETGFRVLESFIGGEKIEFNKVKSVLRDTKEKLAKHLLDKSLRMSPSLVQFLLLIEKRDPSLFSEIASYVNKRVLRASDMGALKAINYFAEKHPELFRKYFLQGLIMAREKLVRDIIEADNIDALELVETLASAHPEIFRRYILPVIMKNKEKLIENIARNGTSGSYGLLAVVARIEPRTFEEHFLESARKVLISVLERSMKNDGYPEANLLSAIVEHWPAILDEKFGKELVRRSPSVLDNLTSEPFGPWGMVNNYGLYIFLSKMAKKRPDLFQRFVSKAYDYVPYWPYARFLTLFMTSKHESMAGHFSNILERFSEETVRRAVDFGDGRAYWVLVSLMRENPDIFNKHFLEKISKNITKIIRQSFGGKPSFLGKYYKWLKKKALRDPDTFSMLVGFIDRKQIRDTRSAAYWFLAHFADMYPDEFREYVREHVERHAENIVKHALEEDDEFAEGLIASLAAKHEDVFSSHIAPHMLSRVAHLKKRIRRRSPTTELLMLIMKEKYPHLYEKIAK